MTEALIQLVGLISLASAVFMLVLIAAVSLFTSLRNRGTSLFNPADPAEAVLLFDGDQLLDASASGRSLFNALPETGNGDWMRLFAWASQTFPEFATQVAGLREAGQLEWGPDPEHGFFLQAEWRSGLQRIVLSRPDDSLTPATDPLVARLRLNELTLLRTLLNQAPIPIWSASADGAVTFANSAYLDLLRPPGHSDAAPPWPIPVLFTPEADPEARSHITDSRGKPRVFQVYHLQNGPVLSGCALPTDQTERAEKALSSFVRTLALTFAGLPVGLAVFDEELRLRLFNPALTDLTDLPVDFLALKPRLFALLDAMRAHQRLPEPRDYHSWRASIAAISQTPDTPPYEDIWSLPGGQTLQIVAHSHAPGALTLLIQDISSEVLRSRRLRHDIAIGQAAIDGLDDGIAVFSAAGQLQLSNAACNTLWPGGTPPDLSAFTASCANLALPSSPAATDLFNWLRGPAGQPALSRDLALQDGRQLRVSLRGLPELAVLLTLRSLNPPRPAPDLHATLDLQQSAALTGA